MIYLNLNFKFLSSLKIRQALKVILPHNFLFHNESQTKKRIGEMAENISGKWSYHRADFPFNFLPTRDENFWGGGANSIVAPCIYYTQITK